LKSKLIFKEKNKWKKIALKEIGVIITGKTPSSKNPEFFGNDFPFITASDLHVNRFVHKTIRGISSEGEKKFKKNMLPENSVIVSCIGWQMGKAAIVGRKSLTNQQINGIIVDPNQADHDYVYYALKLEREYFFRLASSGSRTPILKKSLFEKQKIYLPTLDIQHKISSILTKIDSKIENVQKMNENLDEIIQKTFQSWFLNSDVETKFKDTKIKNLSEWNKITFSKLTNLVIGGIWGKEIQDQEHSEPMYCVRGMDIPKIQQGNDKDIQLLFGKKNSMDKRKMFPGDIIIEISGGSPTQLTGRSLFVTEELLKRFNHKLYPASFCKLIRFDNIEEAIFAHNILKWVHNTKIISQYETGTTGIKNFQYQIFSEKFKFLFSRMLYLQLVFLLQQN